VNCFQRTILKKENRRLHKNYVRFAQPSKKGSELKRSTVWGGKDTDNFRLENKLSSGGTSELDAFSLRREGVRPDNDKNQWREEATKPISSTEMDLSV